MLQAVAVGIHGLPRIPHLEAHKCSYPTELFICGPNPAVDMLLAVAVGVSIVRLTYTTLS